MAAVSPSSSAVASVLDASPRLVPAFCSSFASWPYSSCGLLMVEGPSSESSVSSVSSCGIGATPALAAHAGTGGAGMLAPGGSFPLRPSVGTGGGGIARASARARLAAGSSSPSRASADGKFVPVESTGSAATWALTGAVTGDAGCGAAATTRAACRGAGRPPRSGRCAAPGAPAPRRSFSSLIISRSFFWSILAAQPVPLQRTVHEVDDGKRPAPSAGCRRKEALGPK
mmetsp:Transcript_10988/g.20906  ORF Transcript_10988/g.20906 Transcript_10988/m.20906 type:complete len:229 (+) Transcript_10988:304-990(+)